MIFEFCRLKLTTFKLFTNSQRVISLFITFCTKMTFPVFTLLFFLLSSLQPKTKRRRNAKKQHNYKWQQSSTRKEQSANSIWRRWKWKTRQVCYTFFQFLCTKSKTASHLDWKQARKQSNMIQTELYLFVWSIISD